jgi:DNA-binding MarR family transcriptional regulator
MTPHRTAPEDTAPREARQAEADETVDALVQLSFLVQSALARIAAEHDLSLVQVRLLGILRDRRPAMRELADHLGLDKSSMTGLVARAEKRGLVRREPSPHDGRGVLVALTEEGRRLTERSTAEMRRHIAGLTAPLTAVERGLLRALAGKLLPGGANAAGEPPTRVAPQP